MSNKAFTLVELLAVIAILAIIIVIAYPIITTVIDNSKQNAYETSTELIEDAARYYVVQHDDVESVSLQTLVDEGFLREIPTDPRDNTEMSGIVVINGEDVDYVSAGFNGVHNEPEITSNMYPVKWNGSAWVVTTRTDSQWYSYHADASIDNSGDTNINDGTGAFTSEKWANVHVSTESLSVDDIIAEADLNLYVWIPRYTYLVDEGLETIAFKYSNVTTDDNANSYVSHSAFTFGTEELTGIWVSKFEISADTASDDYGTPSGSAVGVSRPNAKSWRYICISDAFLEARTIQTEFSLSADSHLMKSSEWGAVSYLTEAIRDGEEVWINNQGDSSLYITTGCSGDSEDASSNQATTFGCPTGYEYDEAGVKASTTGNVYGVYDMKGAAWEYVATYINDDTGGELSSSNYALELANADSKYKEAINVSGASGTDNYTNSEGMTLGMALHETSTSGDGYNGWYSAFSHYPYASDPIFKRGGKYSNTYAAGLYNFYHDSGSADTYIGWRAVIVF